MPVVEEVPQSKIKEALAFKAYEIEEVADRFFFRPAGGLFAWAGYYLGMSPNQVTVVGMVVGIASGVMFYWPRLGLWAFAGLILHSILDSADGQLARITKKYSVEGRILDGMGGYFTHISMYLAISCGLYHRGWPGWIFLPMALAGICNAAHAGMYDYFRNQYIRYGIKGELPKVEKLDTTTKWGKFLSFVLGDYENNQRRIARSHAEVQDELARRFAAAGRLSPEAQESYRRRNYWMVRGWNFLGDNTRFYAVGLFAFLGRLEWFFAFNLVVMNLALLVLLLLQAGVDRRYLEDLA